ncbi:hypothetical protein K503DRAFT_774657 [Rhizopogon vinicolor AM-OR11-026]|uniref:Uncharacterized protein n=1 Tax=Rhizopogon vinicolor AM-OR11-026 TaxID=1314800 RepID=A0A1B7MNZ9_9AGAM|nr:hypothetical protein K503DRAFT_774657 [Rhizopogon vinicolor AM-OR11-026]
MTSRAVAVTTDNADTLSPSCSASTSPASIALPTPDHNFSCILPYSNRCAPAFLPTSCRPGAALPTSRCLGAGQRFTATSHSKRILLVPLCPYPTSTFSTRFFVSTPLFWRAHHA